MNAVPLPPEFLLGLREAEETYRELVEGVPAILYIDAHDDYSSNLRSEEHTSELQSQR